MQPKGCKALDRAARIEYREPLIHRMGRDTSTEVGVTSTGGARLAGGVVTEQERSLFSIRPSWVYVCPIVALGAGLCSGLTRAQDCSDLFNPDQVLDFYITMDPTDWDSLRHDCPGVVCPPPPHTYYQANLDYGTHGPILTGIRRKSGLAEPSEAGPR